MTTTRATPAPQRTATPLADAVRLPAAPTRSTGSAPGEAGRAVVGHTLEFVSDAKALVDRMRARYGPTFRITMFGYPVLVVGDPDLVREVLLDRDRTFSSRLGWHHAIGELFARGLMLRDFDDHRFHRRIMQTAFRADAMRGYLERMNPLFERGIAGWGDIPSFRFYPAVKQLLLDVAADVFLGVPLGAEADRINRSFVDAVQASIALLKSEVPPFSYWRGMRGRRFLERFFTELVPARREAGRAGGDLFTELCRATSEQGERFDEREIVDHMIFLLMAAHDTTTSSITTLVSFLARYPEWQGRLRAEARSLGMPSLGWEQRDLPVETTWAFQEALRLHPPVPFIGRRTVRACRLGGFELPENAALNVCSLVTHFLEDWWTEPQRFDPERFAPGRAEDRRHSHSYYPFGGGAHMCLGMHFAYLQMKAFVHQFLLRYEFRLSPGQRVETRPIPIPKPKGGLPLRLRRAA
jgi:cytochrome P450